MGSITYDTCQDYCYRLGHLCIASWEEITDTCGAEASVACDRQALSMDGSASSDVICECGGGMLSLPYVP